jgi:hypothetical protein
MLLLGRLIGDFSVNLERVRAWRVRLTASLSPVAAGDYEITALDDHGRSGSCSVIVR